MHKRYLKVVFIFKNEVHTKVYLPNGKYSIVCISFKIPQCELLAACYFSKLSINLSFNDV